MGSEVDREGEHVYSVEGMTCDHCRAAVAKGVGALPGVMVVDVELESGRLTVRGAHVEDEAVVAAVAEAGYKVCS
jgi:copper chaperone CopZ